MNAFCWIFAPRAKIKHKPFITWEIQDKCLQEIQSAIIEGHDLLIDKSRDMGATWLIIACIVWHFLFSPDTPILMASRKEDLVDSTGDPDTLFWKVDYIIEHLPYWLKPKDYLKNRRSMHVSNENGSSIDGESTNGDIGRGGRKKLIFLDEFAAVENGAEILSSTADTTPCRIFCSTPKGRYNAFANIRFSGKTKVFTLHWKDHPDKGQQSKLIEKDGKQIWTSPWYEREVERRSSKREIAQELDIDYVGSGDLFFDTEVIARIRTTDMCSPKITGEISFIRKVITAGEQYKLEDISFIPNSTGNRLKLWIDLPGGRPDQNYNYVAFADIATGMGSSNSVIDIMRIGLDNKGEQVASFASSTIPPHDFASFSAALCKWFGGQVPVFLGWEANGVGGIYCNELLRTGYPYLLKPRQSDLEYGGIGAKYGWYSNRNNKALLLSNLRRALARGELILHSEESISELEQYIYFKNGSVGPAKLIEEPEEGRALHGDRVIAAAGALLCISEQAISKPPDIVIPDNSFFHRQKEARRREKEKDSW